MPPLTTTVIDDFNRADGLANAVAPGSTIWSANRVGAATAINLRVISNRLGSTAGSPSGWTAPTYGPDTDFLLDCAVAPDTSPSGTDLHICMQGAAAGTAAYSSYHLDLSHTATLDTWSIVRRSAAGADTLLRQSTNATVLAAGDTIWFYRRGGVLTAERRRSGVYGTLVAAVTDGSPLSGAGSFAIKIYDLTQRWDNLSGGTAVAAPAGMKVVSVV